MKISIDNRYCNRFLLGTPIFSVNHSGACLCVQSRIHSRCARAWFAALCLGTGCQKNTVWPQLQAKIWDCRRILWCIAMRNNEKLISIKASQQYLLHVIPHNYAEILDQIIGLDFNTCDCPLFAENRRIGYDFYEFKGLRNRYCR